jgi:CRISPR system Cascade subunit CasA
VESHNLARIVADALEEAAVLSRVLIPLVLDIFGQPADMNEWAGRWHAGAFDVEAIDAYFAEHGTRFDLFSPTCPFDQVADLRSPKNELKPSSVLNPVAASGNSVPLWSARTDGTPRELDPMAAFLALEVTQAFDTASNKTGAVGDPKVKGGKTTGNPVGTLGAIGLVIPQGRTLFETLLLNLPTADFLADSLPGADDAPHWRREPAGPAWDVYDTPRGILDLMTWQSRRVRLVPESTAAGGTIVRQAIVAAGDRLKEIPVWDPRTQWRDRAQRPASGLGWRIPVRHQAGRTSWRGLNSLLSVRIQTSDPRKTMTSRLLVQVGEAAELGVLDPGFPLDVLTVGVEYGNHSATVENLVSDSLPLPVRTLLANDDLHRAVLDAAGQAEGVRIALDDLQSDLREVSGVKKLPWDKGGHAGDEVVGSLDVAIRQFLTALRSNPQDLLATQERWERDAYWIADGRARSLLDAVPPTAFGGRVVRGRPVNEFEAKQRFSSKLRKLLPLAHVPQEGHDSQDSVDNNQDPEKGVNNE